MITICFEGADRVGKETQSKLFTELCNKNGYHTERIEIPYDDGFTHRMIYRFVKSPLVMKFKSLFQVIQVLNKLIFQVHKLKKMQHCDIIVFDRWKMSTEVYGEASGAHPWTWKFSNLLLMSPDYTIILNGEPYSKNDLDEYESDTKFQKNVRELYLHKSFERPTGNGRVITIDVDGKSVVEIQNEILSALTMFEHI